MDYKFFTEEEANYFSEMCKGTNTIRKNRFEEEFYNLHYDELIKGRRGEEWINDAEKEKGLTDNQFLIIKVKALNHGIGCLNYFNGNDIDDRKDILKDIAGNFYKEDGNYIKLLSYILLSSSPKRIDNIDTLDLFIDDLTGILNYKDLRKCYIENYEYRKGVEHKEKQDKEGKIQIDSFIASLIEKEKKYNFNEFRRDIFSDTIATLQKEGKINSLLNDEKIKIFEIWSNCIVNHENFYAIIEEIKKYCDYIGKDYTMALYSIYIKNQYHYYCRNSDYDTTVCYYERDILKNVLRRRIEKKFNGEIDIEDDMAKMFNILDNNTDNKNGYFDITTAKEQKVGVFFCFDIDIIRKLNSYTLLLEEEIEKEIEKKDNIDNISNTTEQRETITKEESIKELTSITNTKEEKRQFSTIYTYEELKEIFRKSIDKGLFETNTRLEDFLYVCGGYEKPQDFKKLNWIKKAQKSKVVNKKMMIYFFMKIFNLNCGNVFAPFINYINNNVIAGEKPVVIGGKPCLTYDPEELKGFFYK